MLRRTDIDNKKDYIIESLQNGVSRGQLCRELNCKYDTLLSRLKQWNMEHLKNQGNRGRPSKLKKPAALFLKLNGPYIQGYKLKLKLWEEGIKEKHCELCGWDTISPDGRLILEIDHINGNNYDNRLSNLRILCPNCHAMQPTNSGLNKKRKSDQQI